MIYQNQVPNVAFTNRFSWQFQTTKDIFGGKRVVLFALSGAFTPTCSSNHLPRYEELYFQIRAQGIDQIICLSVNDPFVMYEWGKQQNIKNVVLLPDGTGEFTRKMGMLVNKDNVGFGWRSWRYSMVVNDCKIEKIFVEPGLEDNSQVDPFEVSDANTMLNYLNSIRYIPQIKTLSSQTQVKNRTYM